MKRKKAIIIVVTIVIILSMTVLLGRRGQDSPKELLAKYYDSIRNGDQTSFLECFDLNSEEESLSKIQFAIVMESLSTGKAIEDKYGDGSLTDFNIIDVLGNNLLMLVLELDSEHLNFNKLTKHDDALLFLQPYTGCHSFGKIRLEKKLNGSWFIIYEFTIENYELALKYFRNVYNKATSFTKFVRATDLSLIELKEVFQKANRNTYDQSCFHGYNSIILDKGKVKPSLSKAKSIEENARNLFAKLGNKPYRDNFKNSNENEFVLVKAGSFVRGEGTGDKRDHVHKVTISKDYWVCKHEVTLESYIKYLEATGLDFGIDWGGDELSQEEEQFALLKTQNGIILNERSWFGVEQQQPMCSLTRNAAMMYCRWLTKVERNAGLIPSDYEYRLPTEAEWEFAARGGVLSKGYKFSGSNNIDDVAYSFSDYDLNGTYAVRTKKPNELGVYDMSGNVSEFCLDRWDNYPASDLVDPLGAQEGLSFINRGGSWNQTPDSLVSTRLSSGSTIKSNEIGFRVFLAPVIVGH